MGKLVCALRSFTTLLVYGVFSGGAVLNGTVVYLLLIILIRDPRKRQLALRKAVKNGLRFFLFLSGILGVFRYDDSAIRDLRDLRGAVIIANHPSLVDFIIIICCLDEHAITMVKNSLTHGFMKYVIKHLGYVNNQSSLEEIHEATASGDNLLIFPEGTRTRNPEALSFQRGAANLAIRFKMPLQPVYIYCDTPGYLSRGFMSLKVPEHVPRFYIRKGELMQPEDFLEPDKIPSVNARHLTKKLETMYDEWLLNCRNGQNQQ